MEKENILSAISKALSDLFQPTEVIEQAEEVVEKSTQSFTSKSLNEELKQAMFIVLEPEVVDAHGDIYSEDEVRKACHNFNKYCRKAYLNHAVETDAIDFVESYIVPDDMQINEFAVKKGTWLAVVQFNDDELWKEAKADNLVGLSIGAYAKVEDLNV